MSPRVAAAASAQSSMAAYESMLMMRRVEERAGQLFALGVLDHPYPSTYGWEALLVALADAAGAGDVILTADVRPGLALALGDGPEQVFADQANQAATADQAGLYTAAGAGAGRPAVVLGGWDEMLPRAKDRVGEGGTVIILASVLNDPARDLIAQLRHASKLFARTMIVLAGDQNARQGPAGNALINDLRQFFSGVGRVWCAVNGGDLAQVRDAITGIGQAGSLAGGVVPVLDVVTPVFQGHAQAAARRPVKRADVDDPIAHLRARLLNERIQTEDDLKRIESQARDRIGSAVERFRARVQA